MHPASLARVDACHRALEELLGLHQEALLAADWPLAGRCLALFHSALRLHIRQEDAWLLPAYAAVEAAQPWPARVFSGEHRKLEAFLARLWPAFRALAAAPSRRAVIELIELEKSLKHLAEHHHLRENEALFPALDAALPEARRRELLARMEAEWRRLAAGRGSALRRLRDRLPAGCPGRR